METDAPSRNARKKNAYPRGYTNVAPVCARPSPGLCLVQQSKFLAGYALTSGVCPIPIRPHGAISPTVAHATPTTPVRTRYVSTVNASGAWPVTAVHAPARLANSVTRRASAKMIQVLRTFNAVGKTTAPRAIPLPVGALWEHANRGSVSRAPAHNQTVRTAKRAHSYARWATPARAACVKSDCSSAATLAVPLPAPRAWNVSADSVSGRAVLPGATERRAKTTIHAPGPVRVPAEHAKHRSIVTTVRRAPVDRVSSASAAPAWAASTARRARPGSA